MADGLSWDEGRVAASSHRAGICFVVGVYPWGILDRRGRREDTQWEGILFSWDVEGVSDLARPTHCVLLFCGNEDCLTASTIQCPVYSWNSAFLTPPPGDWTLSCLWNIPTWLGLPELMAGVNKKALLRVLEVFRSLGFRMSRDQAWLALFWPRGDQKWGGERRWGPSLWQ